jgi:hypothetical protein
MDRRDEFDRDLGDVERTGDILGLGGAPVPKSPDDPSAEQDPEAVAKRRKRVRTGDDEGVSGRAPERTTGATAIDLGAGGTGTDVSGS